MTNNYILNGKDLSLNGLIPARAANSNIALTGMFDMPSRIGKTLHEWAEENGIEPYLRADEILFGGRDLSYNFLIKASSRDAALTKCYALFDDINAFTGLVWLQSSLYGSYQVMIKDEIKIDYIGKHNGYCKGTLTMREPVVDLGGTVLSADNITPSIDNISLKSMGFAIKSMTDQFNRPAAKNVNVTSYAFEGYKVAKTGARTFNLELVGSFTDHYTIYTAMHSLMALLASPNARTLKHNGITREFFVKDGFKVDRLYRRGDKHVCSLTIKATEIRAIATYNSFTDNQGNTLVDGNGTPIVNILKMN